MHFKEKWSQEHHQPSNDIKSCPHLRLMRFQKQESWNWASCYFWLSPLCLTKSYSSCMDSCIKLAYSKVKGDCLSHEKSWAGFHYVWSHSLGSRSSELTPIYVDRGAEVFQVCSRVMSIRWASIFFFMFSADLLILKKLIIPTTHFISKTEGELSAIFSSSF